MSSSQIDNLSNMLNQTTHNNYKKTNEETAMIVANQVNKFWARSITAKITKYADSDGSQ